MEYIIGMLIGIVISECYKCNFHDRLSLQFFDYDSGSYCGYNFPDIKKINNALDSIPKWCPLRDAEKIKECGYKEK